MRSQKYKYTGPEKDLSGIIRYLELKGLFPIYCGYKTDDSFIFWALPNESEPLPTCVERI